MKYAVDTNKLTKKFGSFTAVNELSLRIKTGCIYGLLGSNGSGKSTTIRMLCGLLEPTSGTAEVLGCDIAKADEREAMALRRQIGYMSQKFSLYKNLTAAENIKFYAGLYGLQDDMAAEKISFAVAAAGLAQIKDELVSKLPGGWRQHLALGCAVMHSPRLLFLDEATSGADPRTRRSFWQLIQTLAGEGMTIVVVTHFMEEAELCDELGFLQQGRLLVSGTPRKLKAMLPQQDQDEAASLNKVFAILVRGSQSCSSG